MGVFDSLDLCVVGFSARGGIPIRLACSICYLRSICRTVFCADLARCRRAPLARTMVSRRVLSFLHLYRGQHIAVENIAAIPLPPSLFHWNGLILTRHGVYQSIFCLRDSWAPRFRFWPDLAGSPYTQQAAQLEAVRTYLWYARFPVTNFTTENGRNVIWYADLRFFAGDEHPVPFTFYVSLDSEGKMLDYGWVRRGPGFSPSSVPPGDRP